MAARSSKTQRPVLYEPVDISKTRGIARLYPDASCRSSVWPTITIAATVASFLATAHRAQPCSVFAATIAAEIIQDTPTKSFGPNISLSPVSAKVQRQNLTEDFS